jgi:hypothetical protein
MPKGIFTFMTLALLLCGCDGGTKAGPTPQVNTPQKTVASPSVHKASYGLLTIDSVQQSGAAAELKGSTDLPDDSVLMTSIELYVKNPNDPYIGNQGKATVKGGKWHIKIDFPKVADFAKGQHDATALFTPRGQSSDVLAAVGENGEKLKGKGVQKTMGFNTLETTKRVKLAVTKSRSTMPNPDNYPSSDPRHCLAGLLHQWKNHSWNALAKDATLPESSSVEDRKKEADSWLGFRDLESAEITAVDTEGQISRMTVKVKYAVGSELKEETMGFVALKMDSNTQRSPNGKWRINLQGIRNGGF